MYLLVAKYAKLALTFWRKYPDIVNFIRQNFGMICMAWKALLRQMRLPVCKESGDVVIVKFILCIVALSELRLELV